MAQVRRDRAFSFLKKGVCTFTHTVAETTEVVWGSIGWCNWWGHPWILADKQVTLEGKGQAGIAFSGLPSKPSIICTRTHIQKPSCCLVSDSKNNTLILNWGIQKNLMSLIVLPRGLEQNSHNNHFGWEVAFFYISNMLSSVCVHKTVHKRMLMSCLQLSIRVCSPRFLSS